MPSVRQRVEALESAIVGADALADFGPGMPALRISTAAVRRIVTGIVARGGSTLPTVSARELTLMRVAMESTGHPPPSELSAAPVRQDCDWS